MVMLGSFLTMRFLLFYFGLSFRANEIVTEEIIHPPVGLSITENSGIYLVTFSADNRETSFTGYGFFQAASQADLNTAPSDTLADDATFFCALTTSQLSYESQSTIQLGSGTESSGVLCHLTSFSPVSNNYLAIDDEILLKNH